MNLLTVEFSEVEFFRHGKSYQRTFPVGTDFLYTWYRTPSWTQPDPNEPQGDTQAPNHLYSPAPCQPPLSGSADDCYVTSFWNAFMQHVCGVSSIPSQPLKGKCWVKNYELWNEFNAEQFWTGPAQNLAKMGVDAATVIREYCGDCQISAGSTSAAGAGSGADSSFNDPNGQPGNAYYDTAQGDLLDQWYNFVGTSGMPDFVSWHPYVTWFAYKNQNSVEVPLDPAPFPENIFSGDGNGYDNNDGTGSDFHNGSAACSSSVVDEYSVDYYNPTAQYAHCGDSIVTQISKLKNTIIPNHHMAGKPLWATEGGFGILYDLQGTVPGNSGMTSRVVLRQNFIARWLILLKGSGVARAYPYAYDADNGNTAGCYMPQYYPQTMTCTMPSGYSNGDGWNGESFTAGTISPIGQAWLQAEVWLNGASTPVCTAYLNGGFHVHACSITRTSPAGYHATIYWIDDWDRADTTFVPTPPAGKHFTQYQYLGDPGAYFSYSGGVRGISGGPIMMEGIN